MANSGYDIAHIRKYVEGKLTSKEMHELERAAHADEMLMDLIQGMEAAHEQNHPFPQHAIQELLRKRSASSPVRRILLWQISSAAAAVLAIIGISTYFLMRSPSDLQPNTLSKNDAKLSEQLEELAHSSPDSSIDRHNSDSGSASASRLAAAPTKPADKTVKSSVKAETTLQGTALAADVLVLDTAALLLADANRTENTQIGVSGAPMAAKKVASAQPPTMIRGMSTIAANKTSQTVVFGKVLDSETDTPLPHVIIKDLVSKKTIKADSLGRFLLVSDSNQVNLALSSIGYRPQQLLAKTSELEIRLQPDEQKLEEVVVLGYSRKNNTPKKAQPEGGWRAFNTYLKKSASGANLSEGTVKLSFALAPNGAPTAIHVEQSVDTAHDNRAIQILQNGPRWKHGRKEQRLHISISFAD